MRRITLTEKQIEEAGRQFSHPAVTDDFEETVVVDDIYITITGSYAVETSEERDWRGEAGGYECYTDIESEELTIDAVEAIDDDGQVEIANKQDLIYYLEF